MILRRMAVAAWILLPVVLATGAADGQTCTAPSQARIFIGYVGPASGCTPASGTCNVGESIAFDAQSFGYQFQACDVFTWEFGDGVTATGKTVAHVYQAAATFTAVLRVSNPAGVATAEAAVRVGASSADCTQPASRRIAPYFENASCSPASGPCRPPDAIAFTVQGDVQACDVFSWNFGDGTSGSGRTVSHIYQAVGPYTVVLTISNPTGSATRPVTLEVSAPDPAIRSHTSSLSLVAPAGEFSNAGTISLFTDAGEVPWTASSASPWIGISPASGTVSARQGAKSLTVLVDATQLPPAEYTGSVLITPASGGPFAIPLTVRVTAPAPAGAPAVELSTRSIEFFGQPIRPVTIALTNPSLTTPLTWDLRSPFLNIDLTSGTLLPGTSVDVQLYPGTFASVGFGTIAHFLDVFTNGRISASIPVRITSSPDPVFTTRDTADGLRTGTNAVAQIPKTTVVVPAVGSNLPGGGGSLWTSDVYLTSLPWLSPTNRTSFTYTPIGTPNGLNSLRVVGDVLTPMTLLSSPVTHLFRLPSGYGAMELHPQALLGSWSRIYTKAGSGDGTYGQDVPGFDAASDSVIRAGETGVIPVILGGAFRTNLLLVEMAGQASSAVVSVRDASGQTLQTHQLSLTPWEQRPINNLLGSTAASIGYAVLTMTGDGAVGAFASLVDNSTNDPTTVLMSKAAPGTGVGHILIPGALHASGAGNTTWRSDVWLVNSGSAPLEFDPVLYAGGGTANGPRYTVPAGAQVALVDTVLRDFGRDSAAGAILLDVTSGDAAAVRVFSRTFNVDAAGGTFGQGIGAVRPEGEIRRSQPALTLFGLQRNRSFRTNLQLQETTGSPVTLQIEGHFLSPSGSKASPKVDLPLGAFEYRQVGDILGVLGFPDDGYNPRLTIRVLSGEGGVTAYGAIVDNTTGDPTTVPAFKLEP